MISWQYLRRPSGRKKKRLFFFIDQNLACCLKSKEDCMFWHAVLFAFFIDGAAAPTMFQSFLPYARWLQASSVFYGRPLASKGFFPI